MSETFAFCLYLAALPFEQASAMGVTAIKLAGGLALVVWLFSRLRSLDPVRWDLGLTLMTLFVFWGGLSAFWSINTATSISKLPTYVLLLLSYFLILNVVRNERQLSAAMIALWLGTLMLLASGAVSAAEARLSGEFYRITGLRSNANEYVAMLVACIPSFYWVVTRTRVPLRRSVTVVALVVAAITSLYSQSRGGIVSIVVVLLGLLAFRQTRRRGIVFAVLFLVIAFRMAPLGFWQRWEEVQTERGDVRISQLWPRGLAAFVQRPLLGSGLGTNAQAIAPGQKRATGVVVHNAPLAVAIELGLPGLGLYLGFTAYALVLLLRALAVATRQGRLKEAGFAIVLVACFWGYLASWVKSGGAEAQKMHWVLLGLMSAYSRLLKGSPRAVVDRGSPPGRWKP